MFDTPIVAPLAKKFRLDVAIRRALLGDDGGFLELRLSGSPEEVGRAVADLHTTGVQVTGPLPDTILDGDMQARPAQVGRGT